MLTNKEFSEICDKIYKDESRREKRMDIIKKMFGRKRNVQNKNKT